MHDEFFIRHNGQTYNGRRFLRAVGPATYQTLFYEGRLRVDPIAYAQFATDDPAMNASAGKFLADMVDEQSGEATTLNSATRR